MLAIAGVITALLALVLGLVMGWMDPWPHRHNDRLYLVSSSVVLSGLLGTIWAWLVSGEMTGTIRFLTTWFVLSVISGLGHGLALALAPRIRRIYHEHWPPKDC